MKHLSFSDKTVFVGDAAASALLAYAARLADSGRADTVDLNVIGPDGHLVVATFLLDPGASLMAEDADDAAFDEPDNSEAIAVMEKAMRELRPTPISSMSSEEIASLIPDMEDPSA